METPDQILGWLLFTPSMWWLSGYLWKFCKARMLSIHLRNWLSPPPSFPCPLPLRFGLLQVLQEIKSLLQKSLQKTHCFRFLQQCKESVLFLEYRVTPSYRWITLTDCSDQMNCENESWSSSSSSACVGYKGLLIQVGNCIPLQSDSK